MTVIGFLGFGEAGSTITTGLRAAGMRDIVAYDIAWRTSELIRSRADEREVELLEAPDELGSRADVIVSAVVCTEAERAAASVVPHLAEHHWYLDINSVAPGVKQRIAATVADRGASYVDVAVMANVSSDFSRLPLLVAGPHADEVASLFPGVPLRVTPVSESAGDAARIKMFRSLFVKGLEALSLEAMLACYPSGVHEQVLASFEESFGRYSFPELVQHLIERHAVHGARRANELGEVATALRDAGVAPVMAEAGLERMRWDVERGLQERFVGGDDPDWKDVLEELDRLRREEGRT
jgi:3-hydroxyisobutyrate dehydrogenase-like beta-hydroxyacid dehydrogenase